jgi:hypothetical protein
VGDSSSLSSSEVNGTSLPQSRSSKEESKNQGESKRVAKSHSGSQCKCTASILLVGNSNYMQVKLKMLIKERFHCEVISANDGLEAVGLYQMSLNRECQCYFRAFRLVITELNLPILNG